MHEAGHLTMRQPLRAGVSAFGFGGTNFHAVLEEYRPEVASLASVGLDSQAKTTSTPEPSMNTQGAKGTSEYNDELLQRRFSASFRTRRATNVTSLSLSSSWKLSLVLIR